MTTPYVSAGGVTIQSIAIEPSGKHLYCSTSGDTGSRSTYVAQFTIDQATGALTLMSNPTVNTGRSAFGACEIVTVGN